MLRMEIALFLVLALLGAFLLPISYVETPQGSYSAGPYAVVSYAGVAFYLVLCAVQMCIRDRNRLDVQTVRLRRFTLSCRKISR